MTAPSSEVSAVILKRALTIGAAVLVVSCTEPDGELQISDAERASAAADMTLLRQALDTIDVRHREVHSGLLLNDGASVGALNDAEVRLGCRLPLELRTLWQWRNGERSQVFIWYHRFLSLEAAMNERDKLLASEWSQHWHRNWIPLFEFEGEWYGVECGESAVVASPVVHFLIEDEPRVSYTNLTAYMQTMAVGTTAGVMTWDGSTWRADTRLLSTIHARRNPGIPFPYAASDGG